jgi:hypothetical protein
MLPRSTPQVSPSCTACTILWRIRRSRRWRRSRYIPLHTVTYQALEALEKEPQDKPSRVERHIELVLSYQTYGLGGNPEADAERRKKDDDVESLLWRYRHYPILIVHDFDQQKTRQKVKERVKAHLDLDKDPMEDIKYATVVTRLVKVDSASKSKKTEAQVKTVTYRYIPLRTVLSPRRLRLLR